MLKTLQLIYKANNRGIILWTENDKLKSRFPSDLNDQQIIQEIREHKEEIIQFLNQSGIHSGDLSLPHIYSSNTLDKYPLSFPQERLWFIEQYEDGTNAYHVPILLEIKEFVDTHKLISVLHRIIKRHKVLRTIFKNVDGEYTQELLAEEVTVREYNDQEVNIENQLNSDINTPFNLENEPPVRISLYHEQSRKRLLINIHHIATDGWSADVLFKEIEALYSDKDLSPLPIQYRDFSIWQKEFLQGDVLHTQLNYWKEKLAGYTPLAIPTEKSSSSTTNYSGDNVVFTIDEQLSNQLRSLSKDNACTLYVTMLSALYVLLSRYASQNDIVIGTPVTNRHYSQVEDLIGFFVNSLAIRSVIEPEEDVLKLMNQVQTNLIEAHRHQDIPFEKIVAELNDHQDSSRHPIFQVMFSLQSFGDETNHPLFKATNLDHFDLATYDLSCFIDDSKTQIQGVFNFATSLFHRTTVEQLANHYRIILEQIVNETKKPIKQYDILTKEEYQEIIIDWNNNNIPIPTHRTIHQLFEEQVEKSPKQTAVVFNEETLTYEELNHRSNQIAQFLSDHFSIQPNTSVPIFADRSTEIVIGILGILKSGGAYVPIDPKSPDERVRGILEELNSPVVLTTSKLADRLERISTSHIFDIESYNQKEDRSTNLLSSSRSTDLAYVIYTSGTTNKPKGVMVSHHNVISTSTAFKKQANLANGTEKIAQVCSFSFDPSCMDLMLSLTHGNTLHILTDEQIQDTELFTHYLNTHRISYVDMPTKLYESLGQVNINRLTSLKCMIAGGEALNKLYTHSFTFINAYGPTETTIESSIYINPTKSETKIIGKPLGNEKYYVLDAYGRPVPKGVIGELYIGGSGVALGYLNNPEGTAENFLKNPFATQQDNLLGYSKYYKTGDLVRWLHNGNIEFTGRNDLQVKIRGYRIEPGEIEHAMTSIQQIQQACVVAKEKNGHKYLVAYYVVSETINESQVLAQLSELLPEYMIPRHLIELEEIPVTPNGKLDLRSLRQRVELERTSNESYMAPTTSLEESCCKLWQTLLNVERVGITDDFFKLGGHSILAIELVHKMNADLQEADPSLKVSILDLFKYKNIQSILSNLSVDHRNHVIKKLNTNSTDSNESLFFVPPADAGPEVYMELVNQLQSRYTVFGIENHNLINETKIDSLTSLAKTYLSSMSNFQPEDKINLCGWSLGGQIALEMASVLEQRGFKQINVVLLDTYITDDQLIEFTEEQDRINDYSDSNSSVLAPVKTKSAIQRIEERLAVQQISMPLTFTNVVLFKATDFPTHFEQNATFLHVKSLTDNNIGKVTEKLEIINIHCRHDEVISHLVNHPEYLNRI